MHTLAIPAWIGTAIWGVVIAFAILQGGSTERAGAVAILVGWLATDLFLDPKAPGAHLGVFAVDGLVFAVLVALAMKSSRYWPLWAAGFQLLGVLTHAARLADPKVGAWAYATAGIIWSYLVIFALAWGAWGAWRERRQMTAEATPSAEPGATLR